NSAEADDLVQETFLRALRAREQFQLKTWGIRPWLLRILHNTHVNRAKRERRGPVTMESEVLEAAAVSPPPAPPPAPPGSFDDEELKAAMDQLPPDLRTILLLWA